MEKKVMGYHKLTKTVNNQKVTTNMAILECGHEIESKDEQHVEIVGNEYTPVMKDCPKCGSAQQSAPQPNQLRAPREQPAPTVTDTTLPPGQQ